MEKTNLNFVAPSFIKRLKGMLCVDFYRLFHTPLFYIFISFFLMVFVISLRTCCK